MVNTWFVQQGEAETQCRREQSSLSLSHGPEKPRDKRVGPAEGRRDGASERPWGRLEVRSVEQLLSAEHFAFPSNPSERDI